MTTNAEIADARNNAFLANLLLSEAQNADSHRIHPGLRYRFTGACQRLHEQSRECGRVVSGLEEP